MTGPHHLAVALLAVSGLSGCSAVDDPATYRSQIAKCRDEDRFQLRVGMPEAVMLACSFPGYRPYRSHRSFHGPRTVSVYEGTWQPARIWVIDGRVVDWDSR